MAIEEDHRGNILSTIYTSMVGTLHSTSSSTRDIASDRGSSTEHREEQSGILPTTFGGEPPGMSAFYTLVKGVQPRSILKQAPVYKYDSLILVFKQRKVASPLRQAR